MLPYICISSAYQKNDIDAFWIEFLASPLKGGKGKEAAAAPDISFKKQSDSVLKGKSTF